jgi:hypothetical protein
VSARQPALRIVRDRRGVRLVDGPDVVSHLRAQPGPTHGFFDLLAACIATFAPDAPRARVVVLGFAAGGLVAPLRGMEWRHTLHAVDLSLEHAALFHEIAAGWGGDVRLVQADAAAWLRRTRARWDVILEDLTVRGPEFAIKPAVSVDVLPDLVRDKLAPRGVVAINVLPVPGLSWDELLERLASPHRTALVVDPVQYENRILLAGPALPDARSVGRALRAWLARIGSRQAGRFTTRAWSRRG